jgi:hypothetical protein
MSAKSGVFPAPVAAPGQRQVALPVGEHGVHVTAILPAKGQLQGPRYILNWGINYF